MLEHFLSQLVSEMGKHPGAFGGDFGLLFLVGMFIIAAILVIRKANEKWRGCLIASEVIGAILIILTIIGSCSRAS